jgi:D-sedoheptulose 7-phosphate isomerase
MKMSDLFVTNGQRQDLPQIKTSRQYFRLYEQAVSHLPFAAMEQAAAELFRAYDEGSAVFLFGNGGSAALASHFACDLGKGTVFNGGKRFRVLALTDNVPVMTAWANDSCYEDIFSEQLTNFIEPGDIAFAISGSGNSPNVLRGLEVAREAGAFSIGLTGFQGGKMKILCNQCIVIPSDNMQIIEDLHLSVAHAIFSVLRHSITKIGSPAAAKVAGVFD